MSIDEMIKDGGTLTIEGYYEKGNNGFRTSFATAVTDSQGESEYREVGTVYTSSIRKALKYMPDLVGRYSAINGYRSFEIDLRNEADRETSELVGVSQLMSAGYSICVTKGFSREDLIEASIHGVDGFFGEVKADSVEASLIDSAEFVRECENDFADSSVM